MRPVDRELAETIANKLTKFDEHNHNLPGIRNNVYLYTFVQQILDSIRRVKYPSLLLSRQVGIENTDPNDKSFDPIKAAIYYSKNNNLDEAFWLIFLSTHFGNHKHTGWLLLRLVYGRLGRENRWDWKNTSDNPTGFRDWLNRHIGEIKRTRASFGNHRKYESLSANSKIGTGAVIESYVRWINPPKNHQDLINSLPQKNKDKYELFDYLYHSLNSVVRFGRTARFDYLSMIGNLGFINIQPGCVYLSGSTGPLSGAKLLFGGSKTTSISLKYLEIELNRLDSQLNVGMQVLEDALCNWQKSPGNYKKFIR